VHTPELGEAIEVAVKSVRPVLRLSAAVSVANDEQSPFA
jgi:hypothetical protein